MATLYGIGQDQIIPQSDFDASETENGGVTATQSFEIRKGGIDRVAVRQRFANGTRLTDLDPDCDQFWAYLRIIKIRSIKTIEGGFTMVSCEFAGYSSESSATETGEPDPRPTFARRGVLIEAPLNEHPKWKGLSDTEKYGLGLLINGEAITNEDFTKLGILYDDASGNQGISPIVNIATNDPITFTVDTDAWNFARRIAQGKTTYKQASVSYTHTWQSNSPLSATDIASLGKVTTPAGNPATTGLRDWMMVGNNQVQAGSGEFMFTNELEYLMSEAGGHDDFLYSE